MPARLRGIRIVLVEDHDDSRELLALMLEQCGAEVVNASSARTGLQAVLDNFLRPQRPFAHSRATHGEAADCIGH